MKNIVSVCLVVVIAVAVASCATIQPAPQGVDLVIKEIKVVADGEILEGSPLAFEFTVKNQGTEAVPEAADVNPFMVPRVMVYLGDETIAMSAPIPALQAGEETVLQTEVFKNGTFPSVVGTISISKAGDYALTAMLDPADYINEVSKDNNSTSVNVAVAPKPKEEKK